MSEEIWKRYEAGVDVRKGGFDVGAVLHCCHKDRGYHTHHGYGWRFAA